MKCTLTTLVLLCMIFINTYASASEQIPNLIIMGSDTLETHSDPLRSHPNWEKIRLNISPDSIFNSHTACYEFTSMYVLEDSNLYLTAIHPCYHDGVEFNLDLDLLFDNTDQGRVLCSWYSDEIITSHGKRLKQFHLGYDGVYERYTRSTFSNGVYVSHQCLSNMNTVYVNHAKVRQRLIDTIRSSISFEERKAIKILLENNEDYRVDIHLVRVPHNIDRNIVITGLKDMNIERIFHGGILDLHRFLLGFDFFYYTDRGAQYYDAKEITLTINLTEI